MNHSGQTHSIRYDLDQFGPYAERLREIFTDMDSDYTSVAGKYGFCCSGCEDNCCRTRFYHHTYLELFFLQCGLARLKPEQQAAFQSRANDVCRELEVNAPKIKTSRRMCPLNLSGQCVLYEYRPMICRLHGIPHALYRPGGRKAIGPGCDAFHRQCGFRSDSVLDRTPHYAALAALEQEFRQAMGIADKIRMTVAEMTILFNPY